jgi:hypothetical protein
VSTAVIHPERAAAYARGDLAERMTGVACALACLVRDEDAGTVGAFLDTLSPDEVRALLIVQAAMIPLDVAPAELLAWVTWDEFGGPLPGAQPATAAPAAPVRDTAPAQLYEDCGTMRAFWRHQKAGHSREQAEACGCAEASRDYYVRRYASRRSEPVREVAPKSGRDERAERYAELRRLGFSRFAAAAELGISLRTTHRYDVRLKAAGERAA